MEQYCQKITEKLLETLKSLGFGLVSVSNLKISWTPKAHHVADHYSEYFDDPLTKKQALGLSQVTK